MKNDVYLIKSMYPCQDVPAVIFEKRCSTPCLYCDLYKREFQEEEIVARGVGGVIEALTDFNGAYFSPVTDCFLKENRQLTHEIIEGTWKLHRFFVPLVVTKQIIPEKTIKLFKENKHRLVLQISIPSVDEEFVSSLEPGAATVHQRLQSIKEISKMGIPVIAIVMPWFDFHFSDIYSLPIALSQVGVTRCRIGTGVLPVDQKRIIEQTNNRSLQKVVEAMTYPTQVTTKYGYTIPFAQRIELFRRISSAFYKYDINAKICTADNPDLLSNQSNLPLCTRFRHRLFGPLPTKNDSAVRDSIR